MIDTVTAGRFRRLLAEDPSVPLIDTRSPEEFASWHIPGAVNVPAGPDAEPDDAALDAAIPDDADRIFTICGLGISSFAFASSLEGRGYPPVTVVEDGMVAWNRVYDATEVELADGVTCWQVKRLAKGCLGYLVADDRSNAAVAIDAPIHLDEVATLIEEHELELQLVIDTHVHADHLSGGPALAEWFGVPYAIGSKAADRGLAHDHQPLGDGATRSIGEVGLTIHETPGHTSDMVSLVIDEAAVVTADTLFVDGVGRTELESTDEAASLAGQLYDSLTNTILDHPEETTVLPGHFDPTDGGFGQLTDPVMASIGTVREAIDLLTLDKSAFVERIVEDAGDRPPNYRAIIQINLGRRPMPGREIVSELELGPNNCSAAG